MAALLPLLLAVVVPLRPMGTTPCITMQLPYEGKPTRRTSITTTDEKPQRTYLERIRQRWLKPIEPRSRPPETSSKKPEIAAQVPRYAARDWGRNMRSLPQSLILRRISSPLLFNQLVTLACVISHAIAVRTSGPLGEVARVSAVPHTLLGSALGLLLVFRTNAAYDRYWEARKQWQAAVNEIRVCASLACTFLPARRLQPLLRLLQAYPIVLKNHLRAERDTRALKKLLTEDEIDALGSVVHKPQFVLGRLRALMHASRKAGVGDKERELLLKCTSSLGECLGACERIVQTPIPLHYSRHTSRFVTMYVSTLPFLLVGALGALTLPVMGALSWALFGILEIGHLIEEPFSSETDDDGQMLLPLNDLCRTIRRDVVEVARHADIAEDHGLEVSLPPMVVVRSSAGDAPPREESGGGAARKDAAPPPPPAAPAAAEAAPTAAPTAAAPAAPAAAPEGAERKR